MNIDKELKPLLSWFTSDIEPDDVEFEWEYLLEELDQLIKEINSDGYWYCTVENFGWRNIDGHAYLKFETAKEMISRILPKCECSFNIFREKNIIRIQNYHHDSPTGNEWYELIPITYEQYENQSM